MNHSTLPHWLAILALFSGAYLVWTLSHRDRFEPSSGTASDGITLTLDSARPPIDPFTLTERSGKPMHSKELTGKVWVASYFYTSCPGVCAATNHTLQALQKDSATKDVQFVSITCDPEFDTPSVLQEYAKRFHADPNRWVFCTGDLQTIQQIGKNMMISVTEKGHGQSTAVIDRKGHVRGLFNLTDPDQVDAMKSLIIQCQKEKDLSQATAKANVVSG